MKVESICSQSRRSTTKSLYPRWIICFTNSFRPALFWNVPRPSTFTQTARSTQPTSTDDVVFTLVWKTISDQRRLSNPSPSLAPHKRLPQRHDPPVDDQEHAPGGYATELQKLIAGGVELRNVRAFRLRIVALHGHNVIG
jgi:hypothetical protein